jgi:hypothetical protein
MAPKGFENEPLERQAGGYLAKGSSNQWVRASCLLLSGNSLKDVLTEPTATPSFQSHRAGPKSPAHLLNRRAVLARLPMVVVSHSATTAISRPDALQLKKKNATRVRWRFPIRVSRMLFYLQR